MKIIYDISLNEFDFWSGGADRATVLTYDQMEEVERYLEDMYPDGIGATELNDMFWFEEDFIAEILGFGSFEELEEFNKNNE